MDGVRWQPLAKTLPVLIILSLGSAACAGEPGTTADSPEIPATVLGTQVEAPAPTLGTPVSTFRNTTE